MKSIYSLRYSTGRPSGIVELRLRRPTLAILVLALLMLSVVLAKPVSAVPAGITFSRITPVDGTTLLVVNMDDSKGHGENHFATYPPRANSLAVWVGKGQRRVGNLFSHIPAVLKSS